MVDMFMGRAYTNFRVQPGVFKRTIPIGLLNCSFFLTSFYFT